MKKLGLMVVTAVALVAAIGSSARAQDICGITVDSLWFHCEYRDFTNSGPRFVWRDGLCQNGDTLVMRGWYSPGCYGETGVITATASDPNYGYDMSVLRIPRTVRFNGKESRYIELRLKGIYAYENSGGIGSTSGGGNGDDTPPPFSLIPVNIVPVSSSHATIVDDEVINVPWAIPTLCVDCKG